MDPAAATARDAGPPPATPHGARAMAQIGFVATERLKSAVIADITRTPYRRLIQTPA
jgi:hypothetical protein